MASRTSTDRIEKLVNLDVPRSRVWRALTDFRQFNAWFGSALTAPNRPGRRRSLAGSDRIRASAEHPVIEPGEVAAEAVLSQQWLLDPVTRPGIHHEL
jgi:uncharacterized protein YndB with AHSA1/START domain